MSYCEALEAAGVKVKEYQEFGDYQGTWMAVLEDGRIVSGGYGSCSGCDAFQSEFDYVSEDSCRDHCYTYPPPADCPECAAAPAAYQLKLAEFGRSYLDGNEATKDELLAEYTRSAQCEWVSAETREILEWLRGL